MGPEDVRRVCTYSRLTLLSVACMVVLLLLIVVVLKTDFPATKETTQHTVAKTELNDAYCFGPCDFSDLSSNILKKEVNFLKLCCMNGYRHFQQLTDLFLHVSKQQMAHNRMNLSNETSQRNEYYDITRGSWEGCQLQLRLSQLSQTKDYGRLPWENTIDQIDFNSVHRLTEYNDTSRSVHVHSDGTYFVFNTLTFTRSTNTTKGIKHHVCKKRYRDDHPVVLMERYSSTESRTHGYDASQLSGLFTLHRGEEVYVETSYVTAIYSLRSVNSFGIIKI